MLAVQLPVAVLLDDRLAVALLLRVLLGVAVWVRLKDVVCTHTLGREVGLFEPRVTTRRILRQAHTRCCRQVLLLRNVSCGPHLRLAAAAAGGHEGEHEDGVAARRHRQHAKVVWASRGGPVAAAGHDH